MAATTATALLLAATNSLTNWAPCGDPSQCTLSVTSSPGEVVPWTGMPYISLSYNMSGNTWSTGLGTSHHVQTTPDAFALTFSILQPNLTLPSLKIGVTLIDAADKYFFSAPVLVPGWQNLTLPFFDPSLWTPNTTAPALPLRQVSVGAQRIALGQGSLGFANLALLTNASATALPVQLEFALLQPRPDTSGVLVGGTPWAGLHAAANAPAAGASSSPSPSPAADAPVAVGVQVTNLYQSECTADLVVRMRAAAGPGGEPVGGWDAWVPCAGGGSGVLVPAWSAVNATCVVDPAVVGSGIFSVQAVFNGSSCWRPENDTQTVWEAGVAVVPPQPPYTPVQRNVRSNVFGGQMEPNAASAAAIGMVSVRSGPLWRWNQWSECWDPDCFDWSPYDAPFDLSAAGIEVMIDAREMCPPWAAWKNDSGATYSTVVGPANYPDYQRWMTLMLDRYGSYATAVEVGNEADGYSYFASGAIPWGDMMSLSLAITNLTVAAMAATQNATTLALVGMPSSNYDVKQALNGASYAYLQYERDLLFSPGVLPLFSAVSAHPYVTGDVLPYNLAPWGNVSGQFPNEANAGQNSTVTQLLAIAGLMQEAAAAASAAANTTGLPGNYTPVLHPSEVGYALPMTVAAAGGWTVTHAAAIAQILIHMRSAPLAQYVEKVHLFAAYDGCCAESNGFYGIWRPNLVRTGPNATQGDGSGVQPEVLSTPMPLAGVPAFATASLLLDVPSGRLPGVFVVDHSADGAQPLPGQTSLPPTCVAFEVGPDAPDGTPALAALWITGHHYNDRTQATVTVPGAPTAAMLLLNGVGAVLPPVQGGPSVGLTLSHLPQYLLLPPGVNATAVCASLAWA
jgi:hypothetical protein